MSVATIKRLIIEQGGWLRLYEAIAPELDAAVDAHRRRVSEHVTCPVHGTRRAGNRGDGFRLFGDADATGGAVCNTCGLKSDGLAVLAWLWRCSTAEVLRRVGQAIDSGMPSRRRTAFAPLAGETVRRVDRRASDAEDAARLRAVHGLYEAGLPLDHPDAAIGRRYLAIRGLDPRRFLGDADLRFHPSLHAYDRQGHWLGSHPGLLAAFRLPSGRLVTLQRTYLCADGTRNREFPKLAMRRPTSLEMTGGAIRLGAAHRGVLGVAEGWETAAAVRQMSGIACWATTGWALLEAWVPPPTVNTVLVWADNDESGRGQRSAATLAARLHASGLAAHVVVPPETGSDWCDVEECRQAGGGRWWPPMIEPGRWSPPTWRSAD